MNTHIIFLLFIILFVLLYINIKAKEHFFPRSLNYGQSYKFNRDLEYASNRLKFKTCFIDNIKTQQIAPIMGPQNNMDLNSLWGSARLPDDFHVTSNRIPDKYSTLTQYVHPIVNRIS